MKNILYSNNGRCICIVFIQIRLNGRLEAELSTLSEDERFAAASKEIPFIIRNRKSDNTNKKYDCYFRKFEDWCISNGLSFLSSSVSTVSIFVSSLVQDGVSESVLISYIYSIRWYHMNFFDNPCNYKAIYLLVQGAKRLISKPVDQKEPTSSEIIKNIVDQFR